MRYLVSLTLAGIVTSCGPQTQATSTRTQLKVDDSEFSYHGGSVLHNAGLTAIFWGPSWTSASRGEVGTFLQGFPGSDYADIASQYADDDGPASIGVDLLEQQIDTSNSVSFSDTDTDVLKLGKYVCKINNSEIESNHIYIVLTDMPPSLESNGKPSACGWHSYFSCGTGTRSTIIYVPKLDRTGYCSVGDTTSKHNNTIASMVNVAAHEIMETITDPFIDAWYSVEQKDSATCSQNESCEIADKCSWNFPKDDKGNDRLTKLANGTLWKLQNQWSKEAFHTKGNGCVSSSGSID